MKTTSRHALCLLALASICGLGAMIFDSASTDKAEAKPRRRARQAAKKPRPAPVRSTPARSTALSGRLLFSAERKENTDIFMMKADGTGQQRLSSHPARDTSPTMNRRGEIAFISDRDTDEDTDSDDDNSHLYVMQSDGTGVRRVKIERVAADDGEFGSSPLFEDDPSWSADGKSIAFVQNLKQIRVVNADGSGLRTVSVRTEEGKVTGPRWSPDGKSLLCLARYGGDFAVSTGEIIGLSADGSGQKKIAANALTPSWSPDAKRVAFSSIELGSAFEDAAYEGCTLQTVSPSGGKPRTLLPAKHGFFYVNPTWSPDGKSIAFVQSTTRNNPKAEADAIFLVSASGGKPRRVPGSQGVEDLSFVP